jgi:hypothetical protein
LRFSLLFAVFPKIISGRGPVLGGNPGLATVPSAEEQRASRCSFLLFAVLPGESERRRAVRFPKTLSPL